MNGVNDIMTKINRTINWPGFKNVSVVKAVSLVAQFFLIQFYSVQFLVWCGMSEICLKLKVLAKIDFIGFLACLGVK